MLLILIVDGGNSEDDIMELVATLIGMQDPRIETAETLVTGKQGVMIDRVCEVGRCAPEL